MQAIAYEGYFENSCFYTSGKAIKLPEKKRMVITIFDDMQNTDGAEPGGSVKKRNIGFMEGPPLPDSFFDPLPEEELELWGM